MLEPYDGKLSSTVLRGGLARKGHFLPGERKEMKNLFPDPIRSLPEADIPLDGIKAYLSQAKDHQLIFMQFEKDVDLPEHSHASQVGFVNNGVIKLTMDGVTKKYGKGDIYYIPESVKHSGKILAGYADITFFDEPARYKAKK